MHDGQDLKPLDLDPLHGVELTTEADKMYLCKDKKQMFKIYGGLLTKHCMVIQCGSSKKMKGLLLWLEHQSMPN